MDFDYSEKVREHRARAQVTRPGVGATEELVEQEEDGRGRLGLADHGAELLHLRVEVAGAPLQVVVDAHARPEAQLGDPEAARRDGTTREGEGLISLEEILKENESASASSTEPGAAGSPDGETAAISVPDAGTSVPEPGEGDDVADAGEEPNSPQLEEALNVLADLVVALES